MKKHFFIANWKEHKTTDEAKRWLQTFQKPEGVHSDTEVILCPSFALLPTVKAEIDRLNLPIKLGAQDFPAFEDGAYTGEESPRLLTEYVQFAIIGHSERRNHFAESHELIGKKVVCAKQHGIEPIFCVQDVNTPIPEGVSIVAYEPVSAIGTGNPDSPENANAISHDLSQKINGGHVLYGGSVTPGNVSSFVSQDAIDGVLVGSQSLDPQSFAGIVNNA